MYLSSRKIVVVVALKGNMGKCCISCAMDLAIEMLNSPIGLGMYFSNLKNA